jgi:hypothetical protein
MLCFVLDQSEDAKFCGTEIVDDLFGVLVVCDRNCDVDVTSEPDLRPHGDCQTTDERIGSTLLVQRTGDRCERLFERRRLSHRIEASRSTFNAPVGQPADKQ